MDQTQTTRCVSRFEPLLYVPAFTQKDFHYLVHTGLPTQGTSTEDLGQIQPGVHNSSLKYNLSLEVRHKINHLYTQRDRHKATKTTITSHLRDSNTISTSHQRDRAQIHHSNNQPLHKRDITNKEGLQLGDHKDHKPISFSLNKDPNKQVDMISSSVRNKEFGNKKHKEKLQEKTLDRNVNEDQINSQRIFFSGLFG